MRLGVSPRCRSNPHRFLLPEVLRLYFPCQNPGLHSLSRSPVVLHHYPHTNVGPPSPPGATLPVPVCQQLPRPLAAALLQVVSTRPLISTPPSGLDECFFFNFSVVKLQYSSIFWQFWLFFVFKLFVVLLLVV